MPNIMQLLAAQGNSSGSDKVRTKDYMRKKKAKRKMKKESRRINRG